MSLQGKDIFVCVISTVCTPVSVWEKTWLPGAPPLAWEEGLLRLAWWLSPTCPIAEVPAQAAELTSSLTLNTTLAQTPSPLSWQTNAITLQIKDKRGGKISVKSRLNQG